MATLASKPRVTVDQFLAMQKMAKDAKEQSAIPYSTNTALDAFNNTLARIGYGTNNLLESTSYPLTRLSYRWELLISLYRDNWLVSKMIDGIAEAMVNRWISFPTDLSPTKVKKLEQVFVKTGTQNQILTSLKWARLFGGAGAVMVVKNSGRLDTPLKLDDVPLDSYRGLIVFDRWSGISPSSQVSSDLDYPLDYGLPETYRINLERGGSFEVHSSRVLRFTGRIMPAWEFQADQRWGVSEVERVFQELKKRDNTSYNLASLIFRANIFELRQKNLASLISGLDASAQAQQRFTATIQAQTQLMSNQGIIVSDAESGGLSTHQYGFAGIADVYALFMRDWCAASDFPYSLMFGHEGGLGQNGDADEHTFYDKIGQKQKTEVDPQFRKLVPAVAMSTWGKVPDDLEWKWNPVNNPSDKQKAELASSNTTAVVEAFNAGIVSQRTAGEELKQASSVNGVFTNISDEDLEKMSDEALGGEMQEAALTMGGEGDEGQGLSDKPGKKEKSLEKPKVERKGKQAKDAFPHDLRHPKSGKFTPEPLRHAQFAGFPIVIENPVGSVRSGDGWSVTMKHPYGFISRTEGTDGDEVDVFLGPNERASKAYVIHTRNTETHEFDEDKVMLGFNGADDAIAAFYDNYSDRAFLQGIEMVPISELADKLKQYRGRKIEAYA